MQRKYTVEQSEGTTKLIRHEHIGAGVYSSIVIDSGDYDEMADACMDLNKIDDFEIANSSACEFD